MCCRKIGYACLSPLSLKTCCTTQNNLYKFIPQRRHVVDEFCTPSLQVLISVHILQMPPTAELPGHAFQPNMPVYQQGQDPIIQNCSCARCSVVQRTQAGPPAWNSIEQQDLRHLGVSILYDDDAILHLISLSKEGWNSISGPGSGCRHWCPKCYNCT